MKKCFVFITILLSLYKNITPVNAETLCKIYFLEKTYEENLSYTDCIILGEFMEEKKIKLVLDTLLYNTQNQLNYIPNGTKVLNVKLINKNLFINFNSNIENYGGSSYETNLIRQILHTCFQFEYIQNVTFLIEGKFKLLPEGHLIFKYTREDLEIMDYNENIYKK